jgi:hypothetical protein
MSVQLPEKPWTVNDSFKVEETGLNYVWNGEAWLSDGAEIPADLATESYVGDYVKKNVFEEMTETVNLRHSMDAVKISCSDASNYAPQDSEKNILQGNYKSNGGSRSVWSFGFNQLREYWLYCWDMGTSNCGMTWVIKGNKKFTIDTNGAKMTSAYIMQPHDMSGVDEDDYEKASMAAVEIDIGHRLRELKSILIDLKGALMVKDSDVRNSVLKALENVENI